MKFQVGRNKTESTKGTEYFGTHSIYLFFYDRNPLPFVLAHIWLNTFSHVFSVPCRVPSTETSNLLPNVYTAVADHGRLICAVPYSQVKLHQPKGSSCTLGSYLSNVDPWYNSNVNSLGNTIHKLAKMV